MPSHSPNSVTFFSGHILRNLLSAAFYNVTTASYLKLYDLAPLKSFVYHITVGISQNPLLG